MLIVIIFLAMVINVFVPSAFFDPFIFSFEIWIVDTF